MPGVVAYIDQRIQVAQESVFGTPVATTKKLQLLNLAFQDNFNFREIRPTGHRFNTDSLPEMEWTSWKATGPMDYYESLLLFEAMLGAVTPTTVGATSKQRVYDAPLSGAITQKSFTAQWGDATYANQAAGCVVTGMSGTYDRQNGGQVTADGIGLLLLAGGTTLSGGANPYGASPYKTRPVLGPHLNFYMDTTGAGLGGTQITEEVLSGSWNLQDLVVPFWAADRAQGSWKKTLSNEKGKYTAKLTLGESSVTRAIDANLNLGQTYFLRIENKGALIETTAFYTHNVDIAIKLMSKTEWKNDNSVYARDYDFNIVEDVAWGHAFLVTDVTELVTL